MAKVREAGITGSSTTTSLSRSYVTNGGGAVTAGWLLIAAVSVTLAQASNTPPAGWTVIEAVPDSSGAGFAAWAYKIADGTEDSITWSWPSQATASFCILAFNDAVTTLDDSAEDESNISSVVTSQSSGTATATVASGLAIALFSPMDDARLVETDRAYSDSFAVAIENASFTAARGGNFIVSKAISGTGSYSCTFTTSDTGDEMWGSIALFVTPGGGGAVSRGNLLLMGVGA